ncbi:MAG: glycosyltransferase family 2 protein [Chitinispirillia bacterium]|nr:glycosyltransferase family 2 protein [Chitinispirillia bacterium]
MIAKTVFSIIIPCWNGENFLGNILEILLKQGLKSIEVLVVSDGSTDNTEKIAQKYIHRNSNIKLISLNKNSGVSVARNKGLDNAVGEYVLFLDADDVLPNGTLDFYRILLSTKQYDTLVFGYEDSLNERITSKKTLKSHGTEYLAVQFLKTYFSAKIYCCICCIVFRRAFLLKESMRFAEGVKWGEDVQFYEKAFMLSEKIYYTSKITFTRIRRNNSATQAGKINKATKLECDFIRNLQNTSAIVDRYPEVNKEVNYRVACRYLYYLIGYLQEAKNISEVTKKLLQYKELLYRPIVFVFPRTLVIWALRYVPFKLLFWLFGKK